jgi:eukaryotic-like serine/threonine-protein kinase
MSLQTGASNLQPMWQNGSVVAGRYRIESVIGQGGVGTVYEVVHLASDEHLALKVLSRASLSIPNIRARFEREAKATSRLNHPSIVEAFDFGVLPDSSLFMVMEFVRGASLASAIDLKTLTPARSFAITLEVLEALSHAHRLGIIHRDLKPDNVMLIGDGQGIKLLDFGLAKLFGAATAELGGGELTISGMAFGTPEYMAPEQAMGQAVDPRADLYAVGIMLVEMLTGRCPFQAQEASETVRRKVFSDPPTLAAFAPDREFTPELESFVACAIARSPDERFASAEAMRDALRPIAAKLERPVARQDEPSLSITLEVDDEAEIVPLRRGPRVRERTMVLPRPARRSKAATALRLGLWASATAIVLALASNGLIRATDHDGHRPRVLANSSGQPEASAHLVRGDERVADRRYAEALTAYHEALRTSPSPSSSDRLLAGLTAVVKKADDRVAAEALELLASGLGPRARPLVLDEASHGRRREVRHRAVAVAEREGWSEQVDWVTSYSLELAQAPTCRERLQAVRRLRSLGDKRAIVALQRATAVRRGRRGMNQPNLCLVPEASAAIQELEKLP